MDLRVRNDLQRIRDRYPKFFKEHTILVIKNDTTLVDFLEQRKRSK